MKEEKVLRNDSPLIYEDFKCCNCESKFKSDDELKLIQEDGEFIKVCPECDSDHYLMDLIKENNERDV